MITISKAIEILKVYITYVPLGYNPDLLNSVKLGREALKAIQHSRLIFPDVDVSWLPGETPEEEIESA